MSTVRDYIPALTPAWHAARKGRITASMAPAILAPGEPGVFGNPLEAWLKITGRDDDEREDTDALRWGRESEDLHARLLADKAGIAPVMLQPGLTCDADLPWLGCSPDLLASKDGTEGCVELKAPTDFGMKKWMEAGVPMGYAVQLAVQMRVLRVPWGIVSALIPPAPVWQLIHRSPDMEQWVIEGLTAFYRDHVQTDIPPAIDARFCDERTLDSLKHIWIPEPGKEVHLDDPAALQAALDIEGAKADIKAAEERKRAAEATLIQAAGDAERIWLPDGSGYTRKTETRNMKAQEARTIQVQVMRYHREMR